jgi:hypothetical protein
MNEESVRLLAEISEKLEPLPFWMSDAFWLALLAAIAGPVAACLVVYLTHASELKRSKRDRIRSAYDHILNKIHEAHVLFITSRITDAISGCEKHQPPFIAKDSFEQMMLKLVEAQDKSVPFVDPAVTSAIEKLQKLDYWGSICVLTRPDNSKVEVVAIRLEFNQMVRNVQDEIGKHFS